jgi:hypothetical protein
VAPGAIQGLEDFVNCVGLGETDATVCMKDSATYGNHSCSASVHNGNGVWTAWSSAYACQNQNRAWETDGWNTYYSTSGQGALWAFASPFSSSFTC